MSTVLANNPAEQAVDPAEQAVLEGVKYIKDHPDTAMFFEIDHGWQPMHEDAGVLDKVTQAQASKVMAKIFVTAKKEQGVAVKYYNQIRRETARPANTRYVALVPKQNPAP